LTFSKEAADLQGVLTLSGKAAADFVYTPLAVTTTAS
jgi:hypothetical protein